MRKFLKLLVFGGGLTLVSVAQATEPAVHWTYDHRRCMAFNDAPRGEPSVLLELQGDALTLRAIGVGDMVVSARDTVAIIARLQRCNEEWSKWRSRHPNN